MISYWDLDRTEITPGYSQIYSQFGMKNAPAINGEHIIACHFIGLPPDVTVHMKSGLQASIAHDNHLSNWRVFQTQFFNPAIDNDQNYLEMKVDTSGWGPVVGFSGMQRPEIDYVESKYPFSGLLASTCTIRDGDQNPNMFLYINTWYKKVRQEYPPLEIKIPENLNFGQVMLGSSKSIKLPISITGEGIWGELVFHGGMIGSKPTEGIMGGGHYCVKSEEGDCQDLSGTVGRVVKADGSINLSYTIELTVPRSATAGEQMTTLNLTLKRY